MAKFQLRVIARQAEYGTSPEMGKVVDLSVHGVFHSLRVGNLSLNQPNASGEIYFRKEETPTDFMITGNDENFRLDIFFELDEKRKSLKKMYIQNATDEPHKPYHDPEGKPLASLFVRSWRMGPDRTKPAVGARFCEGIQIDYRYATVRFETYLTDPGSFMIHPLTRDIGSNDVSNDGQEEPMA